MYRSDVSARFKMHFLPPALQDRPQCAHIVGLLATQGGIPNLSKLIFGHGRENERGDKARAMEAQCPQQISHDLFVLVLMVFPSGPISHALPHLSRFTLTVYFRLILLVSGAFLFRRRKAADATSLSHAPRVSPCKPTTFLLNPQLLLWTRKLKSLISRSTYSHTKQSVSLYNRLQKSFLTPCLPP